MTILTFIETPIRVFTLCESFAFLIPFMASRLELCDKLNSMIFVANGATRPFNGRGTGLFRN